MVLTIAGALAYRWRGSGRSRGFGRPACALLIAIPALVADWRLGLCVALFSWLGVSQDHDPGGRDWQQNLASGVLFTGWAALAAAALGLWIAAGGFVLAGAAKAACYRLPEGTRTTGPLKGRFAWREFAFGASWGASDDLALLSLLLI